MCLLESALSLQVHLVGKDPERMSLHRVASDFFDLVGEAFVIEERDIGELVLLQEVAEG